ncbi:MAG: DUF3006 domain-containing protein [Oscillospiraceae bacterium]|nr:DUF3006 domain-containing protein [Oscillospiraceae bacterium]
MTLYSVDEIEGGIATLIDEDDNMQRVCTSCIQAGVKEGDMVYQTEAGIYLVDIIATEQAKQKTAALLKKVLNFNNK